MVNSTALAAYMSSGRLSSTGGQERLSRSFRLFGSLSGRAKNTLTGKSYILDGGIGTSAVMSPVNVASITPAYGYNSGVISISEITGDGFSPGASVKLVLDGETPVEASEVSFVSGSLMSCRIDLTGRKKGRWDVVVENPDGSKGELKEAFEIMTWASAGLLICYPNPFDPLAGRASLIFELEKDSDTSLYLFNISAELVYRRDYASGSNGGKAGTNSIEWDGVDSFSRGAGSGIYFARLIERPTGKVLSKGKIAVLRGSGAATPGKGPDLALLISLALMGMAGLAGLGRYYGILRRRKK